MSLYAGRLSGLRFTKAGIDLIYMRICPIKGCAECVHTGPISRGAAASIRRLELSEIFPNQRRGDVSGCNGIKLGIVGREWIRN